MTINSKKNTEINKPDPKIESTIPNVHYLNHVVKLATDELILPVNLDVKNNARYIR